MSQFTVEIKGNNVLDTIARKTAIKQLQATASTDALKFLAEMVKKPNASKKLLAKKTMIKAFF